MLKKQEVDYIKLCWVSHERAQIKIVGHPLKDCFVLEVYFMNRYHTPDSDYEKDWEQEIKKLKRKVKKYCLDRAVIGMDPVVESVMGKEGAAFDSRKQELLRNRYEVFQLLKTNKIQTRREILIVLEQNRFSLKELELLLLTAKDIYEDIIVFTENKKVMESRAFDFLQNEWGVVVSRISDRSMLKQHYGSVLFVVDEWNSITKLPAFDNGYVLSVEALNDDIRKKLLSDSVENKGFNHLYSGYHYIYQDEEIPYQMAVDLYGRHQNEKNKLSSVAICELKC